MVGAVHHELSQAKPASHSHIARAVLTGDRLAVVRFDMLPLAKISKWAGLDHGEKVLQRAIVRSSFKSMRRKEEARGLLIFDEQYPDRDKSWRMTRKGKAGGWEECFTSPASKDIFNELAYDTLFGLGYVQDERW